MNEDQKNIHDLSDLTCTNLMIRLKILLKKAPQGSAVECMVRRDQRDTIEVPFSKSGYDVEIRRIDINRYHVCLKKNEKSRKHG